MMHIFRPTMKDICEDSSVYKHYQTNRKIQILMLLHFVGGLNDSIKESGGYKISPAS
jgi:hypothetical protein